MSIKRALDNILEGNLDVMRQNFSSALTTKAVEKLEERKIEIAQNYFGQMQEGKESPSKKLKTLDAERTEAGRRANVRNTPEYRQRSMLHQDKRIKMDGRLEASRRLGKMREENQLDELRNFKGPMDVLRYMITARKQIGDMDAHNISRKGDNAMEIGRRRIRGLTSLMGKAKRAQKKG